MSDHKSAENVSSVNATVAAATPPPFPSGPLATTLAVQTLSTAAAYSIPAVAPAVASDVGVNPALVGYFIFTRGLGIGDNDAFDLGGLLSAIIGVVIVLVAYRAVASRSAKV